MTETSAAGIVRGGQAARRVDNAMIRQVAKTILSLELLWLGGVAPLLLFPVSTHGLALLVVPALWGLRWIAHRQFVPRTPLDGSLCLLLLMVGVGQAVSTDPLFSLSKTTGVVLGVALYYALVAQSQGPRGFAVTLGSLVGVTGAITGISLLATSWTAKFSLFALITERLPRVIQGLPGSPPDGFNPNSVAGALLLTVPLLLLLLRPRRDHPLRMLPPSWQAAGWVLLVLATGVIGGTLLLTQSRAGYLGLVAGVAALVLLPHRRLLVGVLTSGMVGAVLVILQPTLFTALLGGPDLQGSPTSLASLQGRVEIWLRALHGIQDFPLTGMGLGMFRHVAPLLYPFYSVAPEWDIGHAHNHLLNAGVDVGVPGLVAYVALWLGAWAMCWEVGVRAQPPYRPLALGLAAGLVAHFVWGMLDTNALGSKAGLPFWLVLASIASMHRVALTFAPLEVMDE